MRKILFVDDEPNVLQGLRRMLHGMRNEWQVEFEESGAAALEALAREPFDIVVSDMKMPGMDGADLLTEVKALHPETIRIILSGHSDKAAILKCIGSTHQYLSKPCDQKTLKATIQRTDTLREVLGNESIKGLIAQSNSLPTLPALFQQIVDELQKPNASLEAVGEIISHDIGMSARILQLVNSSYFGLRQPMSNVHRAVTHLGLETINSLVLSVSIFSQYEGSDVPDFSVDALWQHSMRSAAFARALAQVEKLDQQREDDAFLAGLLHDAGKLVLVSNAPERYRQVLENIKNSGGKRLSVSEAERETLGATHAEIGAYVIGLWGISDSIVEAIAFHARPSDSPIAELGVLTIVHVASGLAREFDATDPGDPAQYFDMEYLAKLGLEDRSPLWRETCREVLERGEP